MRDGMKKFGIAVLALCCFSSPLMAETTVTVAALDLLSDASAFVADEANLETGEGKPDLMGPMPTAEEGAEIQVETSSNTVTTND